jgi:hypothetical protein
MSTFREKNVASYRFESAPAEEKVESFLWKLLLLSALAYFVWSETISIQVGPMSIRKTEVVSQFSRHKTDFLSLIGFQSRATSGVVLEGDVAGNLTFLIDPTYAARHGVDAATVQQRMQQCAFFVKRFSPVAIAEMRKYGVPASILLAQALLASNAGEAAEAKETNNYFQRNCTLPHCQADHFPDPKDLENTVLLDIYPNLWGSFRAQSQFFQNNEPYANLLQAGEMILAFGLTHWLSQAILPMINMQRNCWH